MRVVARVHNGAAYSRTHAGVARLAGFTELDVLVLKVAYLTYHSLAVKTDDADLAARKSYLRNAVFLRHKLRGGTG